MAFSEAESLAIQDLLELDCLLDQSLSEPGCKRAELIKNHFKKVQNLKLPKFDFPNSEWLNISRPLEQGHFEGRLVLLDFFTYCCINCMHILPDLEAIEEAFAQKVLVIGVHSAKFDNEKIGANIENAINRYGIQHPVINDDKASLWQNWSIACWPTVVLCHEGRPLKFFIGEGHREDMIEFISVALDYFQEDLTKATKLALPEIKAGLSHESPLRYPGKVLVQDNLIFISDTGNHRIIVCDLSGKVQKVIGQDRGHADGQISEAKFNSPQGLALKNGLLYICDTGNHVIRCINFKDQNSLVSTIAGNGFQAKNSQIEGQKAILKIALASPWDIVSHQNGLYIAMAGSHQIWDLNLQENQTLTLKAGNGKEENRNNSYPLKAAFAQPSGLCLNGNDLYIADSESSTIRIFNENGVKNICGGSKNPMDLFSFGDLDGLATDARLQHPLGVAFMDEKLFIADSYNHKLKVVTDLKAKKAKVETCPVQGLDEPGGLCFGLGKKLYVADTNNHKIKMVDVETYHVEELKLQFPKVQEEVDFSKASMKLKAIKGQNIKFELKLQPNLTLNTEAPNGYKIEFVKGHSPIKGQIKANLKAEIEAFEEDEEYFALTFKLYLCSNDGICTVKNQKVIFELKGQNEGQNDFVIDIV